MRLNQESYEMLDSHFVELAEMRQSDLNNLNEVTHSESNYFMYECGDTTIVWQR